MFFALDEDQQAFDGAVRSYLAGRFDLEAVRGVFEGVGGADGAADGHPASLWKAAAEQGWLAVTVPEEHDGLGLGLVEAQVIGRALGAGAAPGPWRGTVLAAEAVRLAGSPEQQAAWLPRLASGDAVGAFTLRGSAPGTLPAVEYGALADVVVARSGDGLVLVTGATATPQGSYDGTTRLASVEAGEGEALPGATAAVVAELEARATVLVAADLAGIAREAITRTVAYDKDRQQFGVPVGSFQAIKHALADLHVAVTLAEHAVLYAAHAVDTGLDGADLAVAVAKAKAGDAAVAATQAMIQYHGGIGYTWEHEAHFFYKRAKRLAGQFGDADAHRARIAELTIG
ncbi:acyl-CoA dehydrogenase family protein [Pseudonocardia sp. KRD-184]|uniref:Acyl-CoA dehydrogenase family protein n=1 Tax=Pseudonocardia oceani TaxID=2792013 RepID=A0ABS6UCC0_9PSEU|nr:acyl-CoA dehydrogenase family protein [Pseudonocardia oceani]MBW0090737.1 acyl-CoA dehydrogenase family protein [Pseudonocardia oceani]MBW0095161.1 acyl-CoA dehydrogenase family protein [Pseudonocardia oceani]MBW0107567.1 acyl-CoA dehydrogenase family protein [Pseudonocardia oceani]MBW0120598.1 acyl-CoA dehydrogenase family protein [Pseudonocardia oceani]MBW0129885.1 acyl-CoA dehydrogenase family protein [Pseudonocardia oceani]